MNDTKLDKIFGRNYKVLKIFLANPDKEFYLTEAANELNASKMSVYRTLERMIEYGLLESYSDNYRRFYKLKDSHLIKHLKVLINLDSPVLRVFLKKVKSKSQLIMLYGSRAEGTNDEESDWDFIVVADDLDYVTSNKTISDLERKYATQINMKLYTKKEYNEIKANLTPFYREIITNKVLLKGDKDEA